MLEQKIERESEDGLSKYKWIIYLDNAYGRQLKLRIMRLGQYHRRSKRCKWVETYPQLKQFPEIEVAEVRTAAESICKTIMDAAHQYELEHSHE